MRDGVVLRADVLRPTEDGKFPVLVYSTPYGKEAAQGDYTTFQRCCGACVLALSLPIQEYWCAAVGITVTYCQLGAVSPARCQGRRRQSYQVKDERWNRHQQASLFCDILNPASGRRGRKCL